MATEPNKIDRKAEFRANRDDLVSTSELDVAYDHERKEKLQDQARTEQVLIGMDDAETLLAGRRGLYGVSAARDLQVAQDAREKTASDDMLFFLLLSGGNIAEYIADQVFGDMSDAEVAEVVAEIEAKTGKSFDAYAQSVLGDDVPARKPGESDADYQRRVLQAVAEEIIDPVTGEIKPEYQNDPLAAYIVREDKYIEITGKVAVYNTQLEQGKSPEEIRSALKADADKDYGAADVAGNLIDASTLSGTATESQDGHTDASLVESGDFAMFGGDGLVAKENAMDARSADFKDQFASNAAPTDPPKDVGPAPILKNEIV